eukprot:1947626-Rhodomonas_salina.2
MEETETGSHAAGTREAGVQGAQYCQVLPAYTPVCYPPTRHYAITLGHSAICLHAVLLGAYAAATACAGTESECGTEQRRGQ